MNYFISYVINIPKSQPQFRNNSITIDRPIESLDDIEEIELKIKNKLDVKDKDINVNNINVVIINWKAL